MEGNERYINPYTDFQKEYWDYTSTLQTAEKKGRANNHNTLDFIGQTFAQSNNLYITHSLTITSIRGKHKNRPHTER